MHRQIYGFVKFITYLSFYGLSSRTNVLKYNSALWNFILSISFIESSGLFPVEWTIRDNRRQSQPQPSRGGVEC